MALSKYEWLFVACTILWAIGGAIACVVTLIKRKVSKEVRFANWDTAVCTALVCGVLAYVYAMMAIAFPPYQRSDGREVIWFRDAALVGVVTVGVYITAIVGELCQADGIGAALLTAFGCAAVFGGNSVSYSHTWAPFIVGVCVAAAGHVVIAVRMAPKKQFWPRATLVAQVVSFAALALTQALSWTMTQTLDRDPHRFVSEILYAAVAFASVFGVGALASFSMPEHSHTQ